MKWFVLAAFAALATAANSQTLRIGLAEDPDILDPTMARTFVGRIVFAGLCDKLFDLDEKLNVVPQLATSYQWSSDNKALTIKLREGVTFHDGEKMDAQAVKYTLERHKNMKGPNRRGELAVMSSVDAVDASTVRINLSAPFAPLLAVLTDRAGMMVSPKAAEAAGEKFGARPVCSGPFRFVERIAQDRIVVERFPNYWNKGQIHFERIVYQPIVDATVRLANLRSGQLDFIVRVAFELSLDRDAIVKVAMEGEAQAGNQWVAPSNRFYGKSAPIPKRNVARAKQLLKEAGVPNPSFTLMTPTTSDAQRIAQVVQAMAKDAGFDIKIHSTEFATSLNLADKGQFEAYVLAWSGRADPDGNLHTMLSCKGPTNYAGYCKEDVESLINQSRTSLEPTQRAAAYDKIAQQVTKDRPIIYLFHRHWLWAHNAKLTGLRTVPDGMVRVQGLKMN